MVFRQGWGVSPVSNPIASVSCAVRLLSLNLCVYYEEKKMSRPYVVMGRPDSPGARQHDRIGRKEGSLSSLGPSYISPF